MNGAKVGKVGNVGKLGSPARRVLLATWSAAIAGWAGAGCGNETLIAGVSNTAPGTGGQGGLPAAGVGGAGPGDGGADAPVPAAGGASGAGPRCTGSIFRSVGLPGTPLAGPPGRSAVGDWNRDGIPDLATVIPTAGTVNVLVGKGDGTFLPRREAATGAGPWVVAAGDLNRDGNLDLVTANSDAGSASVLLGKGDGTFAPRADYATGAGPTVVAIGDWTSDGKLDFIAGDSLFVGNGDGTFNRGVPYGVSATALASADFNRDGYLDLIAQPNGVTTMVVVLLGRGDGTFLATSMPRLALNGDWLSSITIADLNADGVPDVTMTGECQGRGTPHFYYFIGAGDGTFASGPQYDLTTGCGATIGIGDTNGDGKTDIMIGPYLTWFGNGDGTLLPSAHTAPATSDTLLAVADWNRDGKLDLAVADGDLLVKVLPGRGDGTFGIVPSYPMGDYPSTGGVLADIDGDGRPDAIFDSGAGSMSVLHGKGDGTFGLRTEYPLSPRSIQVGDLNGDGVADLVAIKVVSTTVVVQDTVTVMLGKGHGAFGPATDYRMGDVTVDLVGLGDVDGDGDTDIITLSAKLGVGGSVSVLMGQGDGTFLSGASTDVTGYGAPTIADLNGDHRPDVVVDHYAGLPVIEVMAGSADGTFSLAPSFSTDVGPSTIAIADMNRDGVPDLVTSGGQVVGVWLGAGDGTFSPPILAASLSPYPDNRSGAIGLADLNGDGALDVVLAEDHITVLLGRGDGTLACAERYGVDLVWPGPIAVGDLNGDGRPDLLSMGNTATVFLSSH